MTTPQQDPAHKRSATRAPVGRSIKLQFDDSMDVIEGLCRNISIGGMFIVFESSRPTGSLVRFELELGDNTAIRGLGEVVWIRSRSEHGGPEGGFGLKFRFLEQRDRQLIFKLVSQHIKERLAKRGPAGGEEGERAAGAAPAEKSPPSWVAIPPEPPAKPEPVKPKPVKPRVEPEPVEPKPVRPEAVEPKPVRPEAVEPKPVEPRVEPKPVEPEPVVPEPVVPKPPPAPELPPETEPPPEPFALESPEISKPPAEPAPVPESPPAVESFEPRPTFEPAELPEGSPASRPSIDLDPSVGQTPIYELGLDPEPEPPPFESPESFAGPAPVPSPSAPDSPGESGWQPEAEDEEDSFAGPPRRRFSLLPVVAVLLLAAGAGYYLFQDEIRERFRSGPPPVETAVETESGEPATPSEEAAPPEETEPEEAAPPPEAAEPPAEAAAPPPEEAVAPPPRVAPPAAPAPPPPTAASPPPAVPTSFSRLDDISWSTVAGGLKVTLTADGDIPTGRYRYFHLGGASPREVFKLTGVRQKYRQNQIAVGGPGVERIRTGFHRVDGGTELHVVLDLAGPRWKVTEVRNLGSRLELIVGEE